MQSSPTITKLINSLTRPSVLALLFTIAIIPFLSGYTKYKVKLIDSGGKSPTEELFYEDLNNDGQSEKIVIIHNPGSTIQTIIYEDSKIIDQWNYPGELPQLHHHFFGDYNLDGLKEMFVFNCKNDSLFLSATEVFSGKEIIKERFITQHYRNEGISDIFIQDIQLVPGNNKDKLDLFFAIFGSYSYRPRKLFIYNIEKDTLISTPESASCFDEPFLFDIDNDKRMEFFGRLPAFGNSPSDFPYTDSISWMFTYDHDLNLMFEPIQVGIYPARLTVKPYFSGNQFYLVTLYLHKGKNETSKLAIYSLEGQLIKQIELELWEEGINLYTNPDKNINTILLHYPSFGIIREYNFNLDLINTQQIVKIAAYSQFIKLDIDNDKEDELIATGKDIRNMVICRSDFSHSVTILFQEVSADCQLSVKKDGNINELFLTFEKSWYLYEYKRNHMYYIQYLEYLGIFILLFLIISIIARLQRIRAEQKFEDERQMTALQLNALDNQLNPHFNLNILNSIGALYESQKIDKAQYYFGKYSKLLRQSVLHSGKIAIPIKEEIEFVRNYLELEKLRMNFSFDYKIEGEDTLPEVEVPKMLIHSFIENSIKHGIKHLKEGGKIGIRFETLKNQLKITISDDGIGREKAKQYSSMSTGKGLQIVNEALDIYFKLKKVRIDYKISDIYNSDGKPGGTLVKISVPF